MLRGFFSRVIQRTEENKSPFGQYILLFFSILAVRLSLEFFSSRKLFTHLDVIHIGLWFSCIVMAFMILLKLFSGEKMVKTAKVVITFFTIALTAPVLDLLITGGSGMKMAYLAMDSWEEVLYSYVTVGGASLSRGATLGIRIEILILIWASYNYFRTKGKSVPWSLLGTWVIYTALFLSGAVPQLMRFMLEVSGLTFSPEGHLTADFLYALLSGMLILALYLHNPRVFQAKMRHLPWAAIAGASVAMFLGFKLYSSSYTHDFKGIQYADEVLRILFALLCLIQIGGYGSLRGNARTALLTWAAATALMAGFHFFFAAALGFGAWFILQQEPLKLSASPLLGMAFPSLLANYAAFSGFMLFGGPMIGFPPLWILALALGGLSYALYAETEIERSDTSLLSLEDFVKRNVRIFQFIAELAFVGALFCLYWLFPDPLPLLLSLILIALVRFVLLFSQRMDSTLSLWFSTAVLVESLIIA